MGVNSIDPRKRRFQNAVASFTLLRELLEWRSGAFRHKITPGINHMKKTARTVICVETVFTFIAPIFSIH
jgi:hypothetical protein